MSSSVGAMRLFPLPELVGDFKNPGQECRPKGQPEAVRVHDLPIAGLGRVSPYGVYDLAVNVGIGHDRPPLRWPASAADGRRRAKRTTRRPSGC